MKAISVKIGGTATPGDILIIAYSKKTKRGSGVSGLRYVVKSPRDEIVADTNGKKSVLTHEETPATIAQGFYDTFYVGHNWPLEEFDFAIDPHHPDTVIIKAKENYEFAGVDYSVEVHGAETETMTMTVF